MFFFKHLNTGVIKLYPYTYITFTCIEHTMLALDPRIKAFLRHHHPYVRKNIALAVFHAHKCFGEILIPFATELMQAFVLVETDIGARCNVFIILYKPK